MKRVGASTSHGWSGRPARPRRRLADRNVDGPLKAGASRIASEGRCSSVRRVAGWQRPTACVARVPTSVHALAPEKSEVLPGPDLVWQDPSEFGSSPDAEPACRPGRGDQPKFDSLLGEANPLEAGTNSSRGSGRRGGKPFAFACSHEPLAPCVRASGLVSTQDSCPQQARSALLGACGCLTASWRPLKPVHSTLLSSGGLHRSLAQTSSGRHVVRTSHAQQSANLRYAAVLECVPESVIICRIARAHRCEITSSLFASFACLAGRSTARIARQSLL
jgi:hypothetical protein